MVQQRIDYDAVYFRNIGYFRTVLTDEILEPIWKEVNSVIDSPSGYSDNSKNLAGNLQHEYNLPQLVPHMQKLIIPLAEEYREEFEYYSETLFLSAKNKVNLQCDVPWVNLQKKGEFNPTHIHSGHLSYVIWLNIPYNSEDELNLPFVKNSNSPCAGAFQFSYVNTLGNITFERIMCDKSMNNTLLIFPSQMQHEVYPFFTSEDYRISVSGNVLFDIKV